MRKYFIFLIIILLVIGLFGGCKQVTTPSALTPTPTFTPTPTPTPTPSDYTWSEPNGRFTVTIPGGFYFSGYVPSNNGHAVTYYFRNINVKRYYVLYWADTTVANFNSVDNAAMYYITIYISQGASPPLINITHYANGVYWAQKFDKTSQTILFFLIQDPQGNLITYDYFKPYSEGELTTEEINEMLPRFASFTF